MKLINQIKSDMATFRRLDKKKRGLFVWDYYKIPILSAAVILAVLITVLVGIRRADTVLYVVMVNANNEADSSIIPNLLEDNGVDLANRKIDVETNYTLHYDTFADTDAETLQVLAVRFGISDMDVFAADKAVFEKYAAKDAFVDLSLFIPKELLNSHEADLYRYTNSDGHEITGGVWLREGSPLHEAGYYQGDVLIGVVANAENLDNALLLIKQLLV
jgi:hypothetical protein